MKHLIKSRQGSALTFVIVTLVVTFLVLSIVALLAQTNIKQAGAQEKGLQAYYAARSGVELAFDALWVTDTGNDVTGTTLLKALKEGATPPSESVDFGEAGTAQVSINYEKNGKDETVTIRSEGHYGGITRNVVLEVYFEVDAADTNKSTLKDMIWSK